MDVFDWLFPVDHCGAIKLPCCFQYSSKQHPEQQPAKVAFTDLQGFDPLVGDCFLFLKQVAMSTEIRSWVVVAKAMEATGATSSQMYVRAKALALGKLDPIPTSLLKLFTAFQQ